MELFITYLELLGTVSFAVSGAATAIKKKMDIFGVCILGVTTAVGGGIIRDLMLGITPPTALVNPIYIIAAAVASVIVFLPIVRTFFEHVPRAYELTMLLSDSAGLGIFTVCGVEVARSAGYFENSLLVVFVAVVTGVGGGVLRDVFAGDRPYIFVKHIYACAAILGAVVCNCMWESPGRSAGMLAGFLTIAAIRLCAAHYRWNLPRS